jgi:CheY-like chemotaxis protein
MNLAVNARDAMPNGGNLSISAENIYLDQVYAQMNLDAQVGNYITITIADTGYGIPPELLDRIFEPFFTTKEAGVGTGLGLFTVQGIIKSHGGFIQVNSVVDQGSRFSIFLPAVQTIYEFSPSDAEIVSGKGELILVVDDETAICEVTTMILKEHNYQTMVAYNGIEAIALYAEHKQKIHTVLMDMLMPEMDGITAIRTLKKINSAVRVIACSGIDATNIFRKNPTIQVQGIIFKPYTANDLLQKLAPVIAGEMGR